MSQPVWVEDGPGLGAVGVLSMGTLMHERTACARSPPGGSFRTPRRFFLLFTVLSDSIPLIMAKTATTKEGALAVIATGGKQYVVHEGTTVSIEKLDGVKEGDTVTFDQVLLVDNGSAKVGMPTVAGAKVTAKVTEIGREKKVEVVRYRQKSRYFKKNGHRQPFVKVQIEKIAA